MDSLELPEGKTVCHVHCPGFSYGPPEHAEWTLEALSIAIAFRSANELSMFSAQRRGRRRGLRYSSLTMFGACW